MDDFRYMTCGHYNSEVPESLRKLDNIDSPKEIYIETSYEDYIEYEFAVWSEAFIEQYNKDKLGN